MGNSTLGQTQLKQGDSHFWQGSLKIKDLFLSCCKFCVRNGKKTRFWEDRWLGKDSLALTFPKLYNFSQNHHITARDAFSSNLSSLSFRRALVGEKIDLWAKMVDLCKNVNDSEDKLSWLLASSREYSVQYFYSAMQVGEKSPDRFLWKVKIPPRIKTFL